MCKKQCFLNGVPIHPRILNMFPVHLQILRRMKMNQILHLRMKYECWQSLKDAIMQFIQKVLVLVVASKTLNVLMVDSAVQVVTCIHRKYVGYCPVWQFWDWMTESVVVEKGKKSNEVSIYLDNKMLLICMKNCSSIAPAASCVWTKRTAARCIASFGHSITKTWGTLLSVAKPWRVQNCLIFI